MIFLFVCLFYCAFNFKTHLNNTHKMEMVLQYSFYSKVLTAAIFLNLQMSVPFTISYYMKY